MQSIRLAKPLKFSHHGSDSIAVCISRSSRNYPQQHVRQSSSSNMVQFVPTSTIPTWNIATKMREGSFTSPSSSSFRHFFSSFSSFSSNHGNICHNRPLYGMTSRRVETRFIQTRAYKKKKRKNQKIKPKSMIQTTVSKHEKEELALGKDDPNEEMVVVGEGTPTDSANEKEEEEKDTTNTVMTDKDEADFNHYNPLLYKRSPNRTLLPRTLLTMTTLHTGYWIWYVLDFIPAMNANVTSSAAIEDPTLYTVDPTVGYVGLGLAIFMSVGSMVYPKYLISEIRSAYGTSGGLYVKTHTLPFVTVPSKKGGTLYKRKEIAIDDSKDVTDIVYDLNGDLRKFQGHLALRSSLDSKANLLLEIREGEKEVLMEDVLLNSLVKDGSGVGKVAVKKRTADGKESRKKVQGRRQMRKRR